MKIKRLLTGLLVSLNLLPACTSFVLEQNNSIYLAKNLDWEIDRGYIYYNLEGIEKTSMSDPTLVWVSKYKSITNNQFGKEFPLGGLNAEGLVIEELNSYRQGYEYDKNKHILNEFQWVQYQLDNSASVQDVIQSLEIITIRHDILDLHYILADRSGDIAVIECRDDGIRVFRGDALPQKVLSNNNYDQSLRYLAFFKGYGGELPVRNDLSSQGRFVTCVHLLDTDPALVDPIDHAFTILNTVKQDDTRWQFVYDPLGMSVNCKTHCSSETLKIGFEDLKKIKHNRWAVPLFKEHFKKEKMTSNENEAQLKFIYESLNEYFSGKEHVYEKMVKAGGKSLK